MLSMAEHRPAAAIYQEASRGAWAGIAGNALLGLAKVVGGVLGRSEALIASGAETASDCLKSLVVLRGLSLARRPPDDQHLYGHGKAEFLAARGVAAILMLFGAVFGYRAVTEIVAGADKPLPAVWTLWFAAADIVGKAGLFTYKYRLGRRLKIESLVTDAWDHLGDTVASVCALAGIGAALVLGPAWRVFDPAAAVVICAIMFGIGAKAFARAGSALLDEAARPETAQAIRRAAAAVPGVRDTEKLLTRRSGVETHVDLHVEVDPDMPVGRAHDIATAVSEAIRRQVPGVSHVSVHIEPYYPDDH